MSKSKKRANLRQKPTASQEKRFLQIVAVIAVCSLLWILMAPGSGLVAFFNKRSEKKQLEREIIQLKEENAELKNSINRLKNDPQYLEEVARKEYGFLRKNERVFNFPDKNSSKKQE